MPCRRRQSSFDVRRQSPNIPVQQGLARRNIIIQAKIIHSSDLPILVHRKCGYREMFFAIRVKSCSKQT
jgi:hypothetical protein